MWRNREDLLQGTDSAPWSRIKERKYTMRRINESTRSSTEGLVGGSQAINNEAYQNPPEPPTPNPGSPTQNPEQNRGQEYPGRYSPSVYSARESRTLIGGGTSPTTSGGHNSPIRHSSVIISSGGGGGGGGGGGVDNEPVEAAGPGSPGSPGKSVGTPGSAGGGGARSPVGSKGARSPATPGTPGVAAGAGGSKGTGSNTTITEPPGKKKSKTTPEQRAMDAENALAGTSNSQSIFTGNRNVTVDTYNTEFIYYSAVLRHYAPSLSREYDKVTTHLWMRKLFGPEYHSTVLKPKRNRYLLYLSITLYNDETFGIFKTEPPTGVLPELKDIPFEENFPLAAWEQETQWRDTVEDLPDEFFITHCYLHDGTECPPSSPNLQKLLDNEFQFFLWLSRPYIALVTDPEDKTILACWIQMLCALATGPNDCLDLKTIRNEYLQALVGYVHDLRIEGPFRLMPPIGPIPPLCLLYERCETEEFNPPEKEAESFLESQPLPDHGAFAYINVTGELFGGI